MGHDKLSWKASGEYEFISFFPGAPGHLPLHMQAQQPPPQQVILSYHTDRRIQMTKIEPSNFEYYDQ